MKLPVLRGTNGKAPNQVTKADLKTFLDNSAAAAATMGGGGGGGASTGLPLLLYKSRGDQWTLKQKTIEPDDVGRAVIAFDSIMRGMVEWIGNDGRNKKMVSIGTGEEVTEADLPNPTRPERYSKSSDGIHPAYDMSGAFMDSSEPFTFSTSSVGGTQAVRDVIDAARSASAAVGEMLHPVVELDSTSYQHAEFGEIGTPMFRIVGYVRASVANKGAITEKDIISDPSEKKERTNDRGKAGDYGRKGRDDRSRGGRRSAA